MGNRDGLTSLLTRRAFLGFAGKGALAFAVGGLIRLFEPKRRIIRPPGAVPEELFLSLCTRCLKCQQACPVGGLVAIPITESVIAAGTPTRRTTCCHCLQCAYACPSGALRWDSAYSHDFEC